MKKTLFLILFHLFVFSLFARSLDECNEELDALRSELQELKSHVMVAYRKKDHPTINFSERLKVVEINREFVQVNWRTYKNDFDKWFRYKQMIGICENRKKRIDEINARIREINDEKQKILRESLLSGKK